jgi:hypothetical protein
MKIALRFVLFFAPAIFAMTASSAEPTPRNLYLHLALLRFQPTDKLDLVRPFKGIIEGQVKTEDLKTKGLNAVIEGLSSHGTVDVLHRSERSVVLGGEGRARFDAMEERPFVLIGNKDMLPPATKFGLSLELTAKPADADQFTLNWNGTLKWSPELIDRWSLNSERFLSFTTGAAKLAQNLTSSAKSGKDPVDIGLSVVQLFKPTDNQPVAGQIYELPVVKEIAFQSGRLCKNGELIFNSTVSEVGGRPAQAVVLVIWPSFE